jgi:hypothetical protein
MWIGVLAEVCRRLGKVHAQHSVLGAAPVRRLTVSFSPLFLPIQTSKADCTYVNKKWLRSTYYASVE